MYKLSVFHYEPISNDLDSSYPMIITNKLYTELASVYDNENTIFEDIKKLFEKDFNIQNITDKINVIETYIDNDFLKFSIQAATKEKTIFNIIIIYELNEKTNQFKMVGRYVTDDVKFNIPNPPEIPIIFDIVIKLEDPNAN